MKGQLLTPKERVQVVARVMESIDEFTNYGFITPQRITLNLPPASKFVQ